MKIATTYRIIEENGERRVQFRDADGNSLDGDVEKFWDGSLWLSHNQITSCEGLEGVSVGGNLWLDRNQIASCKGLEGVSVGGTLGLNNNQLTSCKGLEGVSVGGMLSLNNNQLTSCEGLKGVSVGGSLGLDQNQLTSCEGLEGIAVEGNLWLNYNQITSCEGLKGASIGENLYLDYNRLASCKGLEGVSIGGTLCLNNNQLASCEGFEGVSVGGDLGLDYNLLGMAPTKKDLGINSDMFSAFLEKDFLYADGSLQRLASKRVKDDLTIYKTKWLGTGRDCFVVQRNDVFCHGDTLKEAIEGLRYKFSDRDVSKFKDWKLDDVKTLDEMIEAYHCITGACGSGIRNFVESRDIKSELTVEEAIEITDGQYKSDAFKEFWG